MTIIIKTGDGMKEHKFLDKFGERWFVKLINHPLLSPSGRME